MFDFKQVILKYFCKFLVYTYLCHDIKKKKLSLKNLFIRLSLFDSVFAKLYNFFRKKGVNSKLNIQSRRFVKTLLNFRFYFGS